MDPTISHSIKHRSKPNDVFYTPLKVAQTHINSIETISGEIWFDPFAGAKVYYNNFPTNVKKAYCEITENKDFFLHNQHVDVICSNPPYSNFDDVLKKTIELNPRVFSYLILEGKLTPKRLEFINKSNYGLTNIYMCKVYKWYGMAVAYTFTKDKPNCATIIYDRIVHK
jgi:hypothetical protein